MKILKSRLFIFILGGIIFSSITAIAANQINAHQVTYTDSNSIETPLDEVLDDLYAKAILDFNTASYNTSQGHAIATRSTSVDVTKGKYLIVRNENTSWARASDNNDTSNSGVSTKTLTCSSGNCTIRQISGYYNDQDSGKFGSYEFIVSNAVNLFYVEINEENDVITTSQTAGASDTSVQYITLEAVKIK